jgi:hypothetical protein
MLHNTPAGKLAMGWETRRGRKYYYRARRIGERVVKEYLGSGPAAEQAAQEDAEARARRKAARNEQKLIERATEPLQAFCTYSQLLIEAELLVLGFYKRRGMWRRRKKHGSRS